MKNIQLGIYAIFLLNEGIEINGKKIKKIPYRVKMLYLRESEPEVSIQFTEGDLDEFLKEMIVISDRILEENFKSNKGRHCDWCGFKDLICYEFG